MVRDVLIVVVMKAMELVVMMEVTVALVMVKLSVVETWY